MDLSEFRQRLRSLGYDAPQPEPPDAEADELYPFTVVRRAVPRTLQRLESDGDETAVAQGRALAALMEQVLADAEDSTADALATRVVDPLCRNPQQLALARPYLGPTTLRVIDRMARLIRSAEAAVEQWRSVVGQTTKRAAGRIDADG
jgi:hypothetical protein